MILITGAAGFIGSNLCHKLVADGKQVIGFDALLTGSSMDNLNHIDKKKFYFIEGDLCVEYSVKSLFDKFNITHIYHLAAETHVDRSIENDRSFWESNVLGTSVLLRYAQKYNILKIINQITDEVYGPKIKGKSKEGDLFLPTSPYAASKAAQYMVGKSYINCYETPIVHTFPVNTFGPRQYPEKLVPKFITKLLNFEKVPLMKSSHFTRNWLAVDDHTDALVFLMDHGILFEDYNISGAQELTNLEVTQSLLDITGRDSSFIQEVEDRKAHDCRYCVNSNKLKKLGWKSKKEMIKFKNYLEKTVQWYKEN